MQIDPQWLTALCCLLLHVPTLIYPPQTCTLPGHPLLASHCRPPRCSEEHAPSLCTRPPLSPFISFVPHWSHFNTFSSLFKHKASATGIDTYRENEIIIYNQSFFFLSTDNRLTPQATLFFINFSEVNCNRHVWTVAHESSLGMTSFTNDPILISIESTSGTGALY